MGGQSTQEKAAGWKTEGSRTIDYGVTIQIPVRALSQLDSLF